MTALLLQGHSVTRKLKSDGKVDTMQTLHNLNEGTLLPAMVNWNSYRVNGNSMQK